MADLVAEKVVMEALGYARKRFRALPRPVVSGSDGFDDRYSGLGWAT
jgi:hypothetical protein